MLHHQNHSHQPNGVQKDDQQSLYQGKIQQPSLEHNIYGNSSMASQQYNKDIQSAPLYSQTRRYQQHTPTQQEQQSFLSQFIPSVMLPPPSPTLSSYNYEEANGWVNNYYDPKRQQQVACRAVDHSEKTERQQQQHQQNRQQQQYYHRSGQLHSGYDANGKAFGQTQHHVLQDTSTQQPPKEQDQSEISSQLEHDHSSNDVTLKQTQSVPLSQDVNVQPSNSTPLTTFPMQTQWTPELRESLLQYAHTLYSTTPSSPLLLSLLHSMHEAYPSHLPTILLLACVYYSHQDYISSLQFNQLILKYDPQYVEAMSNIGTTLRILGRISEAEKWWYQAVRLRPGYWDAVENLVGVLCSTPSTSITSTLPDEISKIELEMATASSSSSSSSSSSQEQQQHVPSLVSRFEQALEVCGFVENYFYKSGKSSDENGHGISAPRRLPALQIPRLQNLFYAKGNLRSALGDMAGARMEYEKGLELVFGGANLISIIHLLALVCGSTVAAAATRSGKMLDASSLPLVLLQPDQVTQIMQLIFPHTAGLLPGLVGLYTNNSKQQYTQTRTTTTTTTTSSSTADMVNRYPISGNAQSMVTTTALRQTMQTTSIILLNLAKLFQDQMNSPSTSDGTNTTKPTLAMLIPLYYFSLALNPSPSTANNLGIILSNLSGAVCSNAVQLISSTTPPLPLTGTMRAMQFYMYGLQLDAQHPHLYTNLGSLLKDMGHLQEAICMYEKAVEFNPKFDVALANLGNAIKDQGRVQDSVQYYRRAVQANPGFVDAICGLVNSLGGVCDWRGRGTVDGINEPTVGEDGKFIPAGLKQKQRSGWMEQLVDIVDKQLLEGSTWGQRTLQCTSTQSRPEITIGEHLIQLLITFTYSSTKMADDDQMNSTTSASSLSSDGSKKWHQQLKQWKLQHSHKSKNEGGWLIRLLERVMRRMQRHWYIKEFGATVASDYAQANIIVDPQAALHYRWPHLPNGLSSPPVPTVLPFHTFTYPLSARQIRLISHRNALRISHTTLTSSWMASHVYPPPPPPGPRLKIGYVSSDFNNHPLAHLMQSVFGFHDRQSYDVYCYATTPTDSTSYRQKIEQETEHFLDVSQWSNQQVVQQIVKDGIHVLVNLNGYTKGARNEIFAARPCPVQCSFMGFAGTLGGGWVDYIVADPIVCPPSTVSGEVYRKRQEQNNSDCYGDFEGDLDPEGPTDDFVYTEKFIYMPHSYFVNDHKQGFQEDHDDIKEWRQQQHNGNNSMTMTPDQSWNKEEDRRWSMRHEVFPGLPDDVVIFANFNQLYKLEPSTFRLWLRILERVSNSVLWLLRFPPAGEQHLKRCASDWSGNEVAQRILFTDVAPKQIHIHRGRVADIFLDTPECNAHTTAADILWSGTPMVTYPKYDHKMCSRVGASIAHATGYGNEMVVDSEHDYEERAVEWAKGLSYHYTSFDQLQQQPAVENTNGDINGQPCQQRHRQGQGVVMDLRKRLFLTREQSRLFDTERWTRNLEQGFSEAWRRWVTGEEMEDVSPSSLNYSGCIWVTDADDGPHGNLL